MITTGKNSSGIFLDLLGNSSGTLRELFGNSSGTLRELFGNSSVDLLEPVGDSLASVRRVSSPIQFFHVGAVGSSYSVPAVLCDNCNTMPDMHVANHKRGNLRPQLISGKSRNTGALLGEALFKKNWPELLDAHYVCEVPGPSACLQDALHMITTGKVLITCPGAKKKKKEEDDEEPRTSSMEAPWPAQCMLTCDRCIQCLGPEYWMCIRAKNHQGLCICRLHLLKNADAE